jgi:hypothetical protein
MPRLKDDPRYPTCGAKTRDGGKCKNVAMANGRCRKHMGKAAVGALSHAYKHGRYSKYLPQRMLEHYNAAKDDSELIALRDELALVDSRIADTLKRVDTGEAGKVWFQLKETVRDFQQAQSTGNVEAMRSILWDMQQLVNKGAADYAAWGEITRLIELRRRVTESERRRLIDMQQSITIERAMVLLARIVDTIKTHVRDRDTLIAISADIRRLVTYQPSRRDSTDGDTAVSISE